MAIGVFVSTGALPTLAAGATAPPALASITLVKVEYWHKDHLGSTAATTNHAGAVTGRYAYDPFGKRRSANGLYDANGTLLIDYSPAVNHGSDRGFTGHEHLDELGLIHMNGRLYDPRFGIFLQADPLIQDALNLQSYNRYIYCIAGPMGCTDPSGYGWLRDIFKAIDPIGYRLHHWAHAQRHNPYVRLVAAIVVSYFTAGAASGWAAGALATSFPAATCTFTGAAMISVAAGVAGGAAGGFVAGAIVSGDLRGAVTGALAGSISGGVTGTLATLIQ